MRKRIYLFTGSFVILSLLGTWIILIPRYEQNVINERTTVIQQLQVSSVNSIDGYFEEYIRIAEYLAWNGENRVGELNVLIRQYIALNPSLLQVTISSPQLTDEYTATTSRVTNFLYAPSEKLWMKTTIDSTVEVLWNGDSVKTIPVAGMRKNFTVGKNVYAITIFTDLQKILKTLQNIAIGGEYSVAVANSRGIVFSNSSNELTRQFSFAPNASVLKTVTLGTERWSLLSSKMSAIPYFITIAVPYDIVIRPAKNLLYFSLMVIAGAGLVLMFIGWFATRQITKPVDVLVRDVEKLRALDFSSPISSLSLPELERIGTTIESMRVVLERYQRLNVEKIIFEEWKNKFLMTFSDDMISITDGNGAFVFLNDKFSLLLKELSENLPVPSKERLLSHPFIKRSKETLREEETQNLLLHFSQMEFKIAFPNRDPQFFRFHDVTIRRGGENLGSMLILHDLTDERMIDQMKTDMMNFIVHELRNPLNSILGFTSLILDETDMAADERTQFLSIVQESGKTMNSLVNRFLDVQRLETGKVEYHKEATDVVRLAQIICNSQKPQLIAKSLELRFTAEPDIPQTTVSADLMREAFLNLLSNAIKYGDENRAIEIDMKKDFQNIIFTITDYGYGISAEDQQKLFSKFFRVTSNKKAAGQIGTGLGLAHVKEVMKYHGGDVSLESNSEIGCRFTLTIPIQ